jgi:hypothetical protein
MSEEFCVTHQKIFVVRQLCYTTHQKSSVSHQDNYVP